MMARDMTRAQFAVALKRNGWRLEFAWIRRPNSGLGVGVITRRDGTIMRRETIAKARRLFAEDDRKGYGPEVFQ